METKTTIWVVVSIYGGLGGSGGGWPDGCTAFATEEAAEKFAESREKDPKDMGSYHVMEAELEG